MDHECRKNRIISRLLWEVNHTKNELTNYKKEIREEVIKMNEEMKKGFSEMQKTIVRFLIFVISLSFGIIGFLVVNYVLNK